MSYSAELEDLLGRLNKYQLKAVETTDGLVCLTGVPCSGKTATIVDRIAKTVADGVDPDLILAMTFTRAAAAEMNDRLKSLGIVGARVGTIHSVCRQIAAADSVLISAGKFDERESMSIQLKKILVGMRRERMIEDDYGVDFEAVKRFIAFCKAKGICYIDGDVFGLNPYYASNIRRQAEHWAVDTGIHPAILFKIYAALELKRSELGLYDYDDMLLWAWLTLISNPEARDRWRNRWNFIIVDETQDSSPVQWDVALLLAGLDSSIPGVQALPAPPEEDDKPHNLLVAGDAAQSIYAFRSAEPDNFVAFANDPRVQKLALPINYRSTPTICRVASNLVRGKRWHLSGDMQPFNKKDWANSVQVKEYPDPSAEALDVISRCQQIGLTEGLKSCAVLSRLRVSLDLAEIMCIAKKMKYIKMASGSLFESSEVNDILAYLRVSCGFDPDGRWVRHVINKP
ncbi:UvrD-helicase domain-containing protein, partial [Candidatus Magnetobacterium casense]